MLVIIDNYDSFTYNLVQYFGELGAELVVFRNDKVSLDEISGLKPDKIVISPGPCTPKEAGISKDAIAEFAGKVPILGVCLGHQCIGEVFGGKIVKAKRIMHGKVSKIYYKRSRIFDGIENPFSATRYHSLVIEKESMPDSLRVIAESDDGEIMGVKHKKYSVWGVQFHPESIMTECGKKLLNNFLKI